MFDWDGTLEDNTAAIHGAGMAIADQFGLHRVDLAYFRNTIGRNWRRYFDDLRALNDLPHCSDGEIAELLVAWDRAFIDLLSKTHLMDDAIDAVSRLQAAGITCSVCSMHDHERLVERTEQFGIDQYFLRVDGLVKRDSGTSKREHMIKHLAVLDLPAAALRNGGVLIGDTDDDAETALEIGVRPLLVTRGQMSRQRLAELVPTVEIFDSLTAAVSALLTPT